MGSKLPVEGAVEEGLLEFIEGGELLAVEGFEALGFVFELIELIDQTPLFANVVRENHLDR